MSSTRDSDSDGCTDAQELWVGKPGGSTTCGDDPYNPYDSPGGATPDVSGSWDLVMERTRADVGAPGSYYNCKADVQQSGTALTAPILCYVDNPSVTVNPDMAPGNATACPPAPATYCGDGLPGAPPPGCTDTADACNQALPLNCPSLPCAAGKWLFSQITDQTLDASKKHTALLGSYDATNHLINLQGCFNAKNTHPGPLAGTYLRAKVNAYTGMGYGNVFPNEMDANCKAGTPAGGGQLARIFAVRQAPGNKASGCNPIPNPFPPTPTPPPTPPIGSYTYAGCRDSDGDGCPDKMELGDNQGFGGLRDPLNRWDYFNPEKVNTPHTQTSADILKVNQAFGKNQGNPAYSIDNDRTGIVGSNSWNLGPPDGQQTAADVLAATKQFNHNC